VDYTLRYTKKALNDLDEIIGRIAEGDDEAASRFGGSLLDHMDFAGPIPANGRFDPKAPQRPQASPQSNPDLLPHQRAQAFS
jgi:hypothetical protein